jgi:hypothetical protein
MIDDPEKTDRLVAGLKESLPVETRLSQILIGTLIKQTPDLEIPDKCNVISIFYATTDTHLCHVSITHLNFNRGMPLFRQIDAYQR